MRTWKTLSGGNIDIEAPCDVCGMVAATTPWLWQESFPHIEPILCCVYCLARAKEWDEYLQLEHRLRPTYPTAPVTVVEGTAAFAPAKTPPQCRCRGSKHGTPCMEERAEEKNNHLYECLHCGQWWVDRASIHFAIGMTIAISHVYKGLKPK